MDKVHEPGTRIMEVLRWPDLWGREVILTDDRWYGKILRKHGEITEEAVELAVADPDQVNWDKAYDDVEVFYREVALPAPHGWSLVKVCVRYRIDEYEGVEAGTVTTAYTVFNINHLERCKWSRDGHCP